MFKTNFTPGPSQLYVTTEDHARKAFKELIPSLSHRSRQFEEISRSATEGLRTLLNIPGDFSIVFTGSATEIWERIIQNLTEHTSHHLVNGAFSQKFYDTAVQLNRKATVTNADLGKGFSESVAIPSTELIALTHNETSTGVSLPLNVVSRIRETNPEALIAVDAVSSLPYPDFDFSQFDSVFFSVQKGFGLPAGLGVWIINQRCIAKAEQLLAKGISIGSYHTLPSLVSMAKKNQTPETPNVLGIYLLGKVVEDMNRRGIQTIRRETEYKAAILYQALDAHPLLKAFVTEPAVRSKTVVVADCGQHTEALTNHLMKKGMLPGDGYGTHKKTQLRFANFPAHSKEQYELLVDSIQEFNG
ncbi:MAG TPA: aminotransferase class V-fold PLP-dependent enzyme [Cyclobacteriaceae bacterium]|nr:aminotransferase class V-fold PLP-dependent enzyme [Cyclobacteriaceae bacterium]HMV10411.1 aminotransferase class V-fold PLP-dependent enzyme [Cyclobacteriaceae bacterium]HMV90786.1 aminotransferase class V-fold PLP-dependent enzyme [Cyclobacteriaceae bacterium]HMX00436.1 aminotransferase class V-fold PLP-dependent enzyme [Cyclobacteriaceae bacterium]HMX50480.1 aminotransferase class V-fold PLP-dependent enzyme [Cyclobacteriaceae bacterium]